MSHRVMFAYIGLHNSGALIAWLDLFVVPVVGVVALFFFFFQAEDGIRDDLVTGVQTCALPISALVAAPAPRQALRQRPAPARGARVKTAAARASRSASTKGLPKADCRSARRDRKSVV